MINGDLYEDFHTLEDPCFFMSDSVAYFRLNNALCSDNIRLINNQRIRGFLYDFFDEIWKNTNDKVVSDRDEIVSIIRQCIAQVNAK